MNNNVSLLEIAKELIIDFFKRFYENGWAARFVLAVFILVVIPFPLSIALIMMKFVAMPYGKENTYRVTSHMPAEAAYEKFGFRFISWECAPPIENSFE